MDENNIGLAELLQLQHDFDLDELTFLIEKRYSGNIKIRIVSKGMRAEYWIRFTEIISCPIDQLRKIIPQMLCNLAELSFKKNKG